MLALIRSAKPFPLQLRKLSNLSRSANSEIGLGPNGPDDSEDWTEWQEKEVPPDYSACQLWYMQEYNK